MPDPKSLRIGDRIRVLSVPKRDLQDLEAGQTHLRDTVEVLTWMVGKEYEISMIDEYGHPWVEIHDFPSENAEHSMAILDTESWILL